MTDSIGDDTDVEDVSERHLVTEQWVEFSCKDPDVICDLRLRFLVNGIVRLVAMRLLYGACDAIFSICD